MPRFATRGNNKPKEEGEAAQKPAVSPLTRLQPVVEIKVWQSKDKQRKDPPAPSTSSITVTNYPPGELPVHPFTEVNNATYVPPCKQNFTTPPNQQMQRSQKPAYHAMAHDGQNCN